MVNEWEKHRRDVIVCQLIGHNLAKAYAVNDRV